jgi:hypothetical protein
MYYLSVIGRLTNESKGGRIVKIKKLLSLLIISAIVMLPSASAFAENVNSTEVTPYIVGIGDSQATAISLLLNEYGGVVYDLFIQNSTEKDWFKWTNTSSGYKRVYATVGGYSGNGVTRAGYKINYNNGFGETQIFYTEKANTTESQTFGNIFVPAGATVYIVVDAPNFSSAPAYHLNFSAYDVN